ncbi:MAG: regulatory protein RecX [Acidobacteriota bacterium]
MAPDPCRKRALDLLARRDHFRAELIQKLVRKGFEPDHVEIVVDDLASSGYVDDARAADRFVRQKLMRAPVGRQKLFADLARRGVDRAVAETAIDAQLPAQANANDASDDDPFADPPAATDEVALAREAGRRWRRRRRPPAEVRDGDRAARARYRAALGRHLAGRGFSARATVAALQDLDDALRNAGSDDAGDDAFDAFPDAAF